jgi:hypothetical protein
MTSSAARPIIAALVLLALGGCSKSAPPPAGKAAGAQVLPGSISDAMLDVDTSQAQPLLQPVQTRNRTTAADIMGDASDSASDAAPPDAADPAKPAAPESN